MDSLLTLEAVAKRYGRREVLRGVSFRLEKGEVAALLGRNGAGKSTLMNLMTGYLAMSAGRIWVGGFDVQRDPIAARRLVGYLPEQPPVYPEFTVTECLDYCARLKGLRAQQARREVERVIELAGLGDYARRLAGRLSKGYRQRLGLAQALLGSPPLLILDEPGSGLDPLQMAQTRAIIQAAGAHSAVLLSSHMLGEVARVSSRALVLSGGRLRYDGPMAQLAQGRLEMRYLGDEALARRLCALPGAHPLPEAEAGVRRLGLPGPATGEIARQAAALALEAGTLVSLGEAPAALEEAFLGLLQEEDAP